MLRSTRAPAVLGKALLSLAGLLVPVLLLEAALRVNFWIEHRGGQAGVFAGEPSLFVSDPDGRLRSRGLPDAADHDSRGYRNETALAAADVAAIGDSLTYGLWRVERQDAWPQQLARLGGLSVYNLGVPGYGPADYYSVARYERPEIAAELVVVMIYMGNDLADAYFMVYEFESDAYAEFRQAEFETEYGSTRRERYAEVVELWQAQEDLRAEYYQAELERQIGPVERFLQGNTRLYWWLANRGLLDPAAPNGLDVETVAFRQWALEHPQDGMAIEGGEAETVLTTSMRAAALDLENPVIAEGLRLTGALIGRMAQDLEREGIHLVAAIMPTKERVYARMVRQAGRRDPALEALDRHEQAATDQLLSVCSAQGLTCLSLLDPLRQAVEAGNRLYPNSSDGHPAPAGYEAVARTLLEVLEQHGWAGL